MRGSIILLIASLSLVYRPDQLRDSYLARLGVQAAPSRAQEPVGASQSSGRQAAIVDSEEHHQRRFHSDPARSLPKKESLSSAGQPHVSDKLLLLTDGRELKLFPLDGPELSATGGHYLVRPANFDLSDQRVVDSLATNRRFLDWLQHKEELVRAARLGGGRQRASILPQPRSNGSKRAPLSDEELYKSEGGWRRPLISTLGHFFDSRFCDQSGRESANKSAASERELATGPLEPASGPFECLVIYWLDRANNAFQLGAAELGPANKFHSLATSFDSRGVSSASRSVSGENVFELRPFPPLDLCQEAAIESAACQALGVRVESGSLKLHAALTRDGAASKTEGRLFSARLEPSVWSETGAALALAQKSLAQSEEFFEALQADPSSMKNLLRRSHLSSQLLFLAGKPGLSTKIAAIDLEPAREGAAMAAQQPSERRISNVLDVQWETTKLKVKRSKSNKLDEPFSVVWMRLSPQCGLVWLTSDKELYATELDQSRVGGSKFLGKLGAGRPLIRAPIVEMQLHANSLFFVDSTRRSLMALQLGQARAAQTGDQFEDTAQADDGGGSRNEPSPNTGPAHRVLLLEMLPIQDFELVVLAGGERASPRTADKCPALSQAPWRHNEAPARRHSAGVHSHASHKEASSTSALARVVTEEPAEEAEARLAQATVFSVPLDQPDEQFNLDKLQMALVICLLFSVIVLLACINCILWRQRAILVAAGEEQACKHIIALRDHCDLMLGYDQYDKFHSCSTTKSSK